MGKSGHSISRTPEGSARPSLLGLGTPGAEHNILDAMSSRPDKAGSDAHRAGRLGWLLLPLLVGAAWLVWTQLQQRPVVRPAQTTVAAVKATPAAPLPSPAAPTESARSDAPPSVAATDSGNTATATATLTAGAPANPFQTLSSPGEPPSGVNPVTQLQASLDPAPASSPPKAASAAASRAAAPVTAAKGGKPVGKPSDKPPAKPVQVAAKPALADAKSSAKVAVKPAPAAAKTNGRDPDVELLSAIMKHLGDEKSAAPAPNTRSAQTIAELVKSCQQKDAIDALLCQRRICEGSWGKAQACPLERAPKPAQTAATH